MDMVIAMDDSVEQSHAPAVPGAPPFIRWNFANPLAVGITRAERARLFETVYWQILNRVALLMESPAYAAAPESVHLFS